MIYEATPFLIGGVAGAFLGVVATVFVVAAWMAAEKARFLGSSRALEEAHAHLTARVEKIRERRKPRRWFGEKKGRA